MSIYQPKIAFNVDGVRLWGEVDSGVIELTAGMWPSAVELRCPIHEFSKLGRDYDRCGQIELYLRSSKTPDVVLKGWFLDHVRTSLCGRRPADPSDRVLEKILVLLDRRWEFTEGRGGHSYDGVQNATDETDTAKQKKQTYFQLLKTITWRLQYASGLKTGNMSDRIPGALHTDFSPPEDVKWDGVNNPTEIQRLLEEAEAVWCMNIHGEYTIEMIGSGKSPGLPVSDRLPLDQARVVPTTPGQVVLTSAPVRAIVRRVIRGVHSASTAPINADGSTPPCFQFIGQEADGTIKPLEYLDWFGRARKVAGVSTPIELLNKLTDSKVKDELSNTDYALSARCLFRMIQLRGDAAIKCLPILTCPAIRTDPESDPLPAISIRGKCCFSKNGIWYTHSEVTELDGWTVIDPKRGIIQFSRPLVRVADGTKNLFSGDAEAIGENDLVVEYFHESSEYGDHRDFFAAAYCAGPGGGAKETDVKEATSPGSKNVRTVSMPEFLEIRTADGDQTTSTNEDALRKRAKAMADVMLKTPDGITTHAYRGFHAVSPNGSIPSVRWNLRDLTTEYDWQAYYIRANRYKEKATIFKQKTDAAAGKTASRSAPAQSSAGTRDYARSALSSPMAEMPPGADWPIVVQLVKDGGLAGDADNDCSWTYTIKTLAGTELATERTPKRARFSKVEYFFAGEDDDHSDYGLAVEVCGESGMEYDLLVAFGEMPKQKDGCES